MKHGSMFETMFYAKRQHRTALEVMFIFASYPVAAVQVCPLDPLVLSWVKLGGHVEASSAPLLPLHKQVTPELFAQALHSYNMIGKLAQIESFIKELDTADFCRVFQCPTHINGWP